MANTKGKNNTKNSKKSQASTNKKTSTSKTKASTKKKATPVEDNFEDPFFEDSTKEIILWVSIALCVLLVISNFGIGGNIGNAVADFLFGAVGIIQYVMPFFAVFGTFFIISNYGNKVAVAKTIAGLVLLIFISVFVELIINGTNILGGVAAFELSKLTHNGGGFIGGSIVTLLFDSFGLFGAYLIDIIVMIVCVIIIIEHFAFNKVQNSSRYHADRAAAKRRNRRERQLLEREANQTRYNEERKAIRNKIEEEIALEKLQDNQTGKRIDKKRSGITSNTTLLPNTEDSLNGISEISTSEQVGLNNVEVTETKRHKLTSGKSSKTSKHSFNDAIVEDTNIQSSSSEETKVNPEPVVINMPERKNNIEANTVIPQDSVEESKATRHSKPSVLSSEEAQKETNNINAAISADNHKAKKPYKYPPLNLLNEPKHSSGDSKEYLNEMAERLRTTLKNFGVEAIVKEVTLGPSVTQYKIQIDQRTKVSKVLSLTDDIKLNLAVTDVRIEAPIPGEPYIGIEVPNKEKSMVGFRELVASSEFKNSKSKISFCVGKDIQGKVIVGNIEKMPHILIAGATGSGKSVCINTIIMSILYHANPDEVKLIMVDPKMVELSVYNGIPHLLIPVVTDPKKAAGALHWAVKEMTDRYELLSQAGVRNIESFNEKVEQDALPESISEDRRCRMPQLVIILDELADLMMVAAADIEDSIVRLAQLARAAGIHLIIATQRPTSNVITGLIKANVPSRIAFSVSSSIDSRVILDMNGAEDLLGNGDMLYAPQNLSKPIRVQGAFVSETEVSKVVDFLKNNNESVDYHNDIEEAIQKSESQNGSVSITGEIDNSLDSLFIEAGKLVIENQKGSIGYLQRNFRIGFNRAARIMDQLCEKGVVGPEMGTKPREIKMSISQFEELISQL